MTVCCQAGVEDNEMGMPNKCIILGKDEYEIVYEEDSCYVYYKDDSYEA